MKEINLKISDRVYTEVRSSMAVKGIAGSIYGTVDALVVKIIESVENGQDEVVVAFKKNDPETPEK